MLKLKIRDKQNCYETRTSHWYIVTSLLLKRLINLSLKPSFRISKSLYS